MPISSLLLVTGAGASRELGQNQIPMPLMDDWRKDLIRRLQQASLRDAIDVIDLINIDKPEQFEERIGAFLAWQRSLPVARSLLALGKPESSYETPKQVDDWFDRSNAVATQVVSVIHDSLFSLFGREQINVWNTGKAYEALFRILEVNRTDAVAVATTNYDVAAELGLLEAGRRPDWGEPQHFQNRQPLLEIRGLVDGWSWYRDPVLHLHGRVGWYLQDDGTLMSTDPNAKYFPHMGQPGLLLPDPNKDYTEIPVLNDMWNEFDKLIAAASHVLVLGHSLHDPRLVEHLQSARNLAVTIYLPPTPTTLTDEVERVRTLIPSASIIPMAFGPELRTQSGDELPQWIASA